MFEFKKKKGKTENQNIELAAKDTQLWLFIIYFFLSVDDSSYQYYNTLILTLEFRQQEHEQKTHTKKNCEICNLIRLKSTHCKKKKKIYRNYFMPFVCF